MIFDCKSETKSKLNCVITVAIVLIICLWIFFLWLNSSARQTYNKVNLTKNETKNYFLSNFSSGKKTYQGKKFLSTINQKYFVNKNLLITNYSNGVYAKNLTTGNIDWSYIRKNALCDFSIAKDIVIVTFQNKFGCTETTAIRADSGARYASRVNEADSKIHLNSTDKLIVMFGEKHLEVWRKDLIKIFEYGSKQALVYPEKFFNNSCHIYDAKVNELYVAITQYCPLNHTNELIVFQTKNKKIEHPKLAASFIISTKDTPAQIIWLTKNKIGIFIPTQNKLLYLTNNCILLKSYILPKTSSEKPSKFIQLGEVNSNLPSGILNNRAFIFDTINNTYRSFNAKAIFIKNKLIYLANSKTIQILNHQYENCGTITLQPALLIKSFYLENSFIIIQNNQNLYIYKT